MAIAPGPIRSEEDIRDEADLERLQFERERDDAAEKQAFFQEQAENEQQVQEMDEEQMAAQAQFAAIQNAKRAQAADSSDEDNTLPWTWFIVALIFALIFDGASAGINLLPYIGGFISSFIIAPLGYLILGYTHAVGGVKFDKRIAKSGGIGLIIELIPVLNFLPGFTLSVILAKFLPAAKRIVREAPGVGKLARKIDL